MLLNMLEMMNTWKHEFNIWGECYIGLSEAIAPVPLVLSGVKYMICLAIQGMDITVVNTNDRSD
jgi:hypothetical protein